MCQKPYNYALFLIVISYNMKDTVSIMSTKKILLSFLFWDTLVLLYSDITKTQNTPT